MDHPLLSAPGSIGGVAPHALSFIDSFPLAARSVMTTVNGFSSINPRYVHADVLLFLYKMLRDGCHPQLLANTADECCDQPGWSAYGYMFMRHVHTVIGNLNSNGFFQGVMDLESFRGLFSDDGVSEARALTLFQLNAEIRYHDVNDLHRFGLPQPEQITFVNERGEVITMIKISELEEIIEQAAPMDRVTLQTVKLMIEKIDRDIAERRARFSMYSFGSRAVGPDGIIRCPPGFSRRSGNSQLSDSPPALSYASLSGSESGCSAEQACVPCSPMSPGSPDCMHTPLPLADPFVVDGAPCTPPAVYSLPQAPTLPGEAEEWEMMDEPASPCVEHKNNRTKKRSMMLAAGMKHLTIDAPPSVRVKTLPSLHIRVDSHHYINDMTNMTFDGEIAEGSTPVQISDTPRTRPIATTACDPTLSRPLPLRAFGTQLPETEVVTQSVPADSRYRGPYGQQQQQQLQQSLTEWMASLGIDADHISDEDWVALHKEYILRRDS